MRSRKSRSTGFTVLEIVLVVGILGVLLGIGVVALRPPAIRSYTESIRALMQQARFEAIKLNRPVLVVWDEESREFQSSVATVGALCSPETVLVRAAASDYGNLQVGFPEGAVSLLWLPNGQARDCQSMGPFPTLIATVSDSSQSRDVRVSITGRVTIE